jgi:hypothetical protein
MNCKCAVLSAHLGVRSAGGNKNCGLAQLADPSCKRCAQAIAAGWSHICAHLHDGSVECAGSNRSGQLGDSAPSGSSNRLTPATVFVAAGIKVAAVAAGVDFTCVLLEASTVHCVGQGRLGQLGHGTLGSSAVAVSVQGLKPLQITQLVAGSNHAAVLYADGSVQVSTQPT